MGRDKSGYVSSVFSHCNDAFPAPSPPVPLMSRESYDLTHKTDGDVWSTMTSYCAQKMQRPNKTASFILTNRQSANFAHLYQHMLRTRTDTNSNTVIFVDPPFSPVPHGKLNIVKDDDFMYICKVKYGGIWLNALIDSGASTSLISDTVVNRHKLKVDRNGKVPCLQSANKGVLQLLGTVTADMQIGLYDARATRLLVMKDMIPGIDIILGLDWQHDHACVTNASDYSMQLGIDPHAVYFSKKFFSPTATERDCRRSVHAAEKPKFISSVKKLKRFIKKWIQIHGGIGEKDTNWYCCSATRHAKHGR